VVPKMMESRNRTTKMKNRILAMLAAPDATLPNPKIAATIAIIRKITVHLSICFILN
jgi:hypothetical protein